MKWIDRKEEPQAIPTEDHPSPNVIGSINLEPDATNSHLLTLMFTHKPQCTTLLVNLMNDSNSSTLQEPEDKSDNTQNLLSDSLGREPPTLTCLIANRDIEHSADEELKVYCQTIQGLHREETLKWITRQIKKI